MRVISRDRRTGFTLIEVMLVMAILAFVTTLMWGSFSQTATNKKALEAAQERTHTVRVALMRMARELEMAYITSIDLNNTSSAYTRTFLTASSQAAVDEVSFSTFAHQRLRGGLNEGDTSIVSYYGARDPDDGRITNLMRRETRRLQADDPKTLAGESYVLCPDVASVKFSFFDYRKKEWQREWDTHTIGMDWLPSHIRITLVVVDERGRDVTYSTDARIRVTEKLDQAQ